MTDYKTDAESKWRLPSACRRSSVASAASVNGFLWVRPHGASSRLTSAHFCVRWPHLQRRTWGRRAEQEEWENTSISAAAHRLSITEEVESGAGLVSRAWLKENSRTNEGSGNYSKGKYGDLKTEVTLGNNEAKPCIYPCKKNQKKPLRSQLQLAVSPTLTRARIQVRGANSSVQKADSTFSWWI